MNTFTPAQQALLDQYCHSLLLIQELAPGQPVQRMELFHYAFMRYMETRMALISSDDLTNYVQATEYRIHLRVIDALDAIFPSVKDDFQGKL